MYKINKILGNNGLVVTTETNEEVILFDKGIGFNQKIGQYIEAKPTTKVYELKMPNKKYAIVVDDLNPIFLEISDAILSEAKNKFHKIDTNILLPLADHLAFAYDRIKKNLRISNPLQADIRLLFADEYKIAEHGKILIKDYLNMDFPEEELGFITLHIHAAIAESKVDDSIMIATIMREAILKIESDYDIKISEDSISFVRLMNHMKFLLVRLREKEELNVDVADFIREKFPYSYQSAKQICEALSDLFQQPISDHEVGYLAIHIERIKSVELEKKWKHLANDATDTNS